MLEDFQEFLDVDIALMSAGLFGGIATLYSTPKVTIKVFLAAVSGGALLAGFLTPIVLEFLNLSENLQSGLAFLIGLFGLNIVGGVFGLSQRFKTNPLDTLEDIKSVKEDKGR